MSVSFVEKVRTVSNAKRDFYTHHTRPINSVYRRIVEELIVEMHLLSVNADFRYDPVYALGVVTAFERFMQGYQPEKDKATIFDALCKSVNSEPEKYRQDAGEILARVKQLSVGELSAKVSAPTPSEGDRLVESLQTIANQSNFKYSRLFAIGLYAILAEADSEIIKDQEKRDRVLKQMTEVLHLPPEKLQKDLDLYRSNLDKMEQLLGVLEETLQADRKKRQEREQEQSDSQTNTETSQ
jgi:photosystem II biogenesis protein Psp29